MKKRKILFRLDGNGETGLGHLVRSLAIARTLEKAGDLRLCFGGVYDVPSRARIIQDGFEVIDKKAEELERTFVSRILASMDWDLLFIDHLFPYSEDDIREFQQRTPVALFHNVCPGRFQADVFILPSAHHPDVLMQEMRTSRNGIQFYAGWDYIVINDDVRALKNASYSYSDLPRVAITTGGSDPAGVMLRLFEYIQHFPEGLAHVLFLPGNSFVHRDELSALASHSMRSIEIKPFSYEDLRQADLVISSFGVTTYELIYWGLPILSVSHAPANAAGSRILSQKLPWIKELGLLDDLEETVFHESLASSLRDLSEAGRIVRLSPVDGKGLERIAEVLLKAIIKKALKWKR